MQISKDTRKEANGGQNKTGSNRVGSRTPRKYEGSLVAVKLTVNLDPGAFDRVIGFLCERSAERSTNKAQKAFCTGGWQREGAGACRKAALRRIMGNRKYIANLAGKKADLVREGRCINLSACRKLLKK